MFWIYLNSHRNSHTVSAYVLVCDNVIPCDEAHQILVSRHSVILLRPRMIALWKNRNRGKRYRVCADRQDIQIMWKRLTYVTSCRNKLILVLCRNLRLAIAPPIGYQLP